jgi:hypothetical protein
MRLWRYLGMAALAFALLPGCDKSPSTDSPPPAAEAPSPVSGYTAWAQVEVVPPQMDRELPAEIRAEGLRRTRELIPAMANWIRSQEVLQAVLETDAARGTQWSADHQDDALTALQAATTTEADEDSRIIHVGVTAADPAEAAALATAVAQAFVDQTNAPIAEPYQAELEQLQAHRQEVAAYEDSLAAAIRELKEQINPDARDAAGRWVVKLTDQKHQLERFMTNAATELESASPERSQTLQEQLAQWAAELAVLEDRLAAEIAQLREMSRRNAELELLKAELINAQAERDRTDEMIETTRLALERELPVRIARDAPVPAATDQP